MNPNMNQSMSVQTLAALGSSLGHAAKAIAISKSALSRSLATGQWPKRGGLIAKKKYAEYLSGLQKEVGLDVQQHTEAVPQASHPAQTTEEEEEAMLLPKQTLSDAARKKFGLFTNPFHGDVRSDDEMFINGEVRFVRETTWQAALSGSFLAIVGESGAGKTTMLDDLKDKVLRERKPLVFIEPSVEGMEDSEARGKGIKSADIQTAVVLSLDASTAVAQSSEKRSRQVKRMLEESTASGRSHLLVIEEAHALPVTTLNHLKRLHERMRLGRRNMLGILLLGHPELEKKLARYDVREVMQRCQVLRLQPLGADLTAYLQVRCDGANRKVDDFITPDGMDELRGKLMTNSSAAQGPVSLLYPLNVNNWMIAALNTAAELGAPVIDRDVVRAV